MWARLELELLNRLGDAPPFIMYVPGSSLGLGEGAHALTVAASMASVQR